MTPVHRLGQMRDGQPDQAYSSVLLVLPVDVVRELNQRCESSGLADQEDARDGIATDAFREYFERHPARRGPTAASGADA